MPVIIRTLSDRETLEVAIVENVQRQNLNPMEEAKGYQRLMDEFSLSSQEVAEKVGKDRATVSNVVRLVKLPVHVQVLVAEGQISVGHAKAILTVKEPAVQLSLAQKVLDEGLSVRALEAIVSRSVVLEPLKTRSQGSSSSVAPKSELDVPHPDLEERLRNVLGTKVTIRKSKQGGAVEVHFYSDSELDRLIDMLVSIEGK
jgi:ParB family chromosome partitioning protein